MVRQLNIDGDRQGDLTGHGGEHRAVFVYQKEAYHYWEHRLGRSNFTFGQFGENFTIEDLPDDRVCIGDRFKIGDAVFEVTQPRVTCYRVGIRMEEPRMAALLTSSGKPGFYFRVLEEGEVGGGDEIVKTADGPEGMTVAEANALLYLPGHPRNQLERAIRIPALSAGWRNSFQSLLQQERSGGSASGNAGLAPAAGPPPAWPGFRRMRVARIDRESRSVFSLFLVSADAHPLITPLPGQFVVLRLQPTGGAPPLLRSYSLSDQPGPDHYRVSVKQEVNGVASSYLRNRVRAGDVLDVSAPRGSFTLRPGERPVVLISAGVGATPVLAMLHALAAEASPREVWWLHGARSSDEHPFARESLRLVESLPHGRSYIVYSKPRPSDRLGIDFDAAGHLDVSLLDKLGAASDADFYLCGPPAFMQEFKSGLKTRGIPPERVHTEVFGPGESRTPGVVEAPRRPPHLPSGLVGSGPRVSFARSGLTVRWVSSFQTLLELAEACDIPVRWSCRTGVCHNCESGLVSGVVDYDPDPLDPPAEGNVLICCSRPREDLVVDL